MTSSVPGEGKSTVAANLALTLAEAGSRVALVDADLRRPSVADYLGLEGAAGLTTVLIGQATLDDVVQPWGALAVLTSGQIPPNPSEMVGSRAMTWVLDELAERYDVVVIDTPPLLPVTDAAILARLTDGALVVAGANGLHRHQLTEALGSLERVGARVLGLVVNRVPDMLPEAYSYYGTDPKAAGRGRRRTRSTRPPLPRGRGTRRGSLDLPRPARSRPLAASVPHQTQAPRRISAVERVAARPQTRPVPDAHRDAARTGPATTGDLGPHLRLSPDARLDTAEGLPDFDALLSGEETRRSRRNRPHR